MRGPPFGLGNCLSAFICIGIPVGNRRIIKGLQTFSTSLSLSLNCDSVADGLSAIHFKVAVVVFMTVCFSCSVKFEAVPGSSTFKTVFTVSRVRIKFFFFLIVPYTYDFSSAINVRLQFVSSFDCHSYLTVFVAVLLRFGHHRIDLLLRQATLIVRYNYVTDVARCRLHSRNI